MLELFEPYILTFIPIFVAVDAIGNVPLFLSLVEGSGKRQKMMIVAQSVTTATIIAVGFMFLGKWVLSQLNITIFDFQIAGGMLLFAIAARLLLPGEYKHLIGDRLDKDVGVFPLGTPLITGPAVLTTALMMRDSFGWQPTLVSIALNMLITWLALSKSDTVMRVLGQHGTRAFAKTMYILLAAIGVMMIRRGVEGAFLR